MTFNVDKFIYNGDYLICVDAKNRLSISNNERNHMKETETEITGNTSMRIYNKKRELGMLYFGTEDYSKIRHFFEGKDLVYKLKKDTGELCIKEQKYPED